MKTCRICKKDKDEQEFNKNSYYEDGLAINCRLCNRARDSKYYKSGNYYIKAFKRNRLTNEESRKWIREYKKKHSCVDCGETNFIVLEFDHVRGKKKFNIGNSAGQGYSIRTIKKEIAKCDIRCANCHRIRTYEAQHKST